MSQYRGNVLFLILIAILLFAALSYAVTSSMRNSGGNISKDAARVNAAAIIQYGNALHNAVIKLKISNGCTDTTLDFNNSVYQFNNGSEINVVNSNAPSKCRLFSPDAGGVSPIVPASTSLNMASSSVSNPSLTKLGHGGVRIFQIKGIGTDGPAQSESANDIVFFINYLNRETCLAINDRVGVSNPGGEPPVIVRSGSSGAYVSGGSLTAGATAIDETVLGGAPVFCLYSPSTLNYQFDYALVER